MLGGGGDLNSPPARNAHTRQITLVDGFGGEATTHFGLIALSGVVRHAD